MADNETRREEQEKLKCITPVGIATFVHVWEPFVFKDAGKGKNRRDRDDDDDDKEGKKAKDGSYSIMLVFDEDEDIDDIKAIVRRAAIKKFGKQTVKKLIARDKFHVPWRDAGDYEDEYGEPFAEGKVMINFKSTNAPGVVGGDKKKIKKQMDFYPGCKARVSCFAWAYDYMGNKGVTLLLNNVQKVGDGTRISVRANAEDEFDAVKGYKAAKKGDFDDDDFDDDDLM